MTNTVTGHRLATEPEITSTGRLVAVCALCGGAGASTLAYLIGAWAAEDSVEPVLVCDAGELTAGLSAYAGVESVRSLEEVAIELAAGGAVAEGLFAVPRPRLRLIAAAPRLHGPIDGVATSRLLDDAREEHPLTVVDCGRLATEAGQLARRDASHVVWVLPATTSGALRARRVLATLEAEPGQTEVVVARSDPAGRQAPLGELTALADSRDGPLVLVPHIPDLAEHPCEDGLAAAQVPLQAIASLLRR
jgi:MinD-like ATPase involved in chromosome partitioning or flagellar assembly